MGNNTENLNIPDLMSLDDPGAVYAEPLENSGTNVIVTGGAKAEIYRDFLIPNTKKLSMSYVIDDPTDEIYRKRADVLKALGYDIQYFTLNSHTSMHYNPFDYIYENGEVSKEKVERISEAVISQFPQMNDDNLSCMKHLLNAYIAYVGERYPKAERNLYQLYTDFLKFEPNDHVPNNGWHERRNDSLVKRAALIKETALKDGERNLSLIEYKACSKYENKKILWSMCQIFDAFTAIFEGADGKVHKNILTTDIANPDKNISFKNIGLKRSALFINSYVPEHLSNYPKWIYALLISQCYDELKRTGLESYKAWDIVSNNGFVVMSGFKTEAEADEYRKNYANVVSQKTGIMGKIAKALHITNSGSKMTIDLMKDATVKERLTRTLPIPVSLMFCRFSETYVVPEPVKMLTNCKKYGINTLMYLPTVKNIKENYRKNTWSEIMYAGDNIVFMGITESTDEDTVKTITDIAQRIQKNAVIHGEENMKEFVMKMESDKCMVIMDHRIVSICKKINAEDKEN